jgi:phosphoserine phosphatase RsbU/P
VIRALLIEDNPGDARLVRALLDEAGADAVSLAHVDRLSDGVRHLAEARTDVVLLDLTLPDSHGFETFSSLHAQKPDIPIVVMSGLDDQALAVRAVHEGAQDYLVKGHADGGVILRSLRYAIERSRLQQAQRDLERQKDEFFSSISHDLRTPVAAIKAAVGVVLANEPEGMPAALHRMLVNIDLASDELSGLIENLLQAARLQSGRVDVWVADADLRDVVMRSVRAVEPLLQTRAQQLNLDLPREPVVLPVDSELFGRALRNVLGNAQKHGRDGGSITVFLRSTSDEVQVAVADDGPGIPLAEQEHIFDRFYRGRGEGGHRPAGTGLGLAIARAFVELQGGRVWVESEPGRGATFWLALPRGPRG